MAGQGQRDAHNFIKYKHFFVRNIYTRYVATHFQPDIHTTYSTEQSSSTYYMCNVVPYNLFRYVKKKGKKKRKNADENGDD